MGKTEDYQLVLDTDEHCDACHITKVKRIISHTLMPRAESVGDFFHFDTFSFGCVGKNSIKYYLMIVDDKSRKCTVCFMRDRGEASQHLKNHCKSIKNTQGTYPRGYHADNISDYKPFVTWAQKKGMEPELTPIQSPEPNGPAERLGGITSEAVRMMILNTDLPLELWPYTINTATYILNRLVLSDGSDPPLQAW